MISNHILTEDVLLVYFCTGILSTKFKDKKLTGKSLIEDETIWPIMRVDYSKYNTDFEYRLQYVLK